MMSDIRENVSKEFSKLSAMGKINLLEPEVGALSKGIS